MAATAPLLSSISKLSPVAKVAPFSVAAPGAKVAPCPVAATGAKFAPVVARFAPITRAQAVTEVEPIPSVDLVLPIGRSDFPEGFIFGSSTSAYQIEGGKFSRGRTAWDHFTHKYPEKITDGANGDVACDSVNLFLKDIEIMKEMGIDAYRFSIAWSRIIPTGKRSDGVSREGIEYYNKLIDELIANGKKPYVTLYHVDRPQNLEEEYGGFLSRQMVDDFKDFADVCFEAFGDRVDNWSTLNEPHVYCRYCYAEGLMAPGRCSEWQDLNCVGGDSATEPYIVAHNLLLAHAAVVDLYRTKYQKTQKGVIGIVFDCQWSVPYSDKESDQQAASRGVDFVLGWFLEPLKSGQYPQSMQELVGKRLPQFTAEESEKLIGSYDYIGINYYASIFATYLPDVSTPPSYLTDGRFELTNFRNGVAIGDSTASGMYVYPKGLRELLVYIKNNYNDPDIYIMENGMAEFNDPSITLEESLMDIKRIDYYFRHLYYLRSAIKDYGVKVKGYFAWSLLDNFEWSSGYTLRFGLNFTDYDDNLKRYAKYSAKWFKDFLKA